MKKQTLTISTIAGFYFNMEPKLTHSAELTFKVLGVKGITPYKALDLIRLTNKEDKVTLVLHSYRWNNYYKTIAAAASAMNINTLLYIEGAESTVNIVPFSDECRNTQQFIKLNQNQKNIYYDYINQSIENIKIELREAKELQQLLMMNNQDKFEITKELKEYIETYAPAYGLPIPRMEIQDNTCTDFLEAHQTALWVEWNKQGLSYYEKQRRNRMANITKANKKKAIDYSAIKRVVTLIEYYRQNNIPYDDNYKDCPICGKPMRTNKYGITDMQEDICCSHCSPEYFQQLVEGDTNRIDLYNHYLALTNLEQPDLIIVGRDLVETSDSFSDYYSIGKGARKRTCKNILD